MATAQAPHAPEAADLIGEFDAETALRMAQMPAAPPPPPSEQAYEARLGRKQVMVERWRGRAAPNWRAAGRYRGRAAQGRAKTIPHAAVAADVPRQALKSLARLGRPDAANVARQIDDYAQRQRRGHGTCHRDGHPENLSMVLRDAPDLLAVAQSLCRTGIESRRWRRRYSTRPAL